MSKKAPSILVAYAALFSLSVYAYHHFPQYRDELRFWIPQMLVFLLITVTTLYVSYTSDLVNETRKLQQRPLVEISFREIPDASALKFERLFAQTQAMMADVTKLVGGIEAPVQTKCLAIEVRNAGQTEASTVSLKVKLVTPSGELREEQEFAFGQDRKEPLRITVAPAAMPWMEVEVESVLYEDGFRKYSEVLGKKTYRQKFEEPSGPIDGSKL